MCCIFERQYGRLLCSGAMVRRRRETAVRRCFWLTPGGFEASRRTQKLQCDAHQLYRQWRHNYTFRESIVGSLISERDNGL
jgi:hypothetical protein